MNRTEISGTVSSYGYRQAMVTNPLIVSPATHGADLWQELADRAGVRPDNHQCFTVTAEDGSTVHYMFSDESMYMGFHLTVRPW